MTNEDIRLEIAKVVEQTYAVGRLDEGIGLDATAHPVLRRITSVDNLMAVFTTALDSAREEAVRDFVRYAVATLNDSVDNEEIGKYTTTPIVRFLREIQVEYLASKEDKE